MAFLRSFTFGHVRQLDRWSEFALTGAWAAGAGPGSAPMTIDIDSTICRTHGYVKQGATFGYTHKRGYHPLVATRAETGEIVHVRFRKGSANTGRGAQRFVRELVGRVRRAGTGGPLTLRADSGFWSKTRGQGLPRPRRSLLDHGQPEPLRRRCDRRHRRRSEACMSIDYTLGGEAQVAECRYGDGHRLVVRRTRIVGAQAELFDNCAVGEQPPPHLHRAGSAGRQKASPAPSSRERRHPRRPQ
jgi:hypothetical protein